MTAPKDIRIRAVACDIDGTLTDVDTRRLHLGAVRALRELTVPVVLVTGNVPCVALTYTRAIGTIGLCVAENGGVVTGDFAGKEHVLADKEMLRPSMDALRERFDVHLLNDQYRKSEFAMRRDYNLEEGRACLQSRGFDAKTLVDSGYALHLKSPNVDKGTGLLMASRLLGIPAREFAAIGDGQTDVELFREVRIAVAVANAAPQLRDAAHFVSESPAGEGAAEALRYLQATYLE